VRPEDRQGGLAGVFGISCILYLRVEHKAWKCCCNIPVQKLIDNKDDFLQQIILITDLIYADSTVKRD
jgi:hypothetical protein